MEAFNFLTDQIQLHIQLITIIDIYDIHYEIHGYFCNWKQVDNSSLSVYHSNAKCEYPTLNLNSSKLSNAYWSDWFLEREGRMDEASISHPLSSIYHSDTEMTVCFSLKYLIYILHLWAFCLLTDVSRCFRNDIKPLKYI